MTTDPIEVGLAEANRRVQGFADEMKEAGIHVGMSRGGDPPACVTCGERWPCPASKEQK